MGVFFNRGNNDIDSAIDLSNTKLQAIYNELLQKIEAGEEIALTAATLAALENVNATITNLPTDYPDTAALAELILIYNQLVDILGEVGDNGTLLESISSSLAGTLTVQGTGVFHVDDNSSSLSVDDGGGSLTVDGSVSVSNFPASVEVSNDSGNPLPVNGTISVGNFPSTQNVSDGGGSLTVDGTVGISGTVPVSAAALPLPAGAATSANQTNGSQLTTIAQGGNSALVDSDGNLQVELHLNATTINAVGSSTDGRSAAASANNLAVINIPQMFNGNTFDRVRIANTFKTVTATASGDTGIWTPTSGKKFRIMAYEIQLTDNASLSVAGLLEVLLRDSTTSLAMGVSFYVPSVAVTNTPGMVTSGWIQLSNGALSAAANNVLNVNLSAALVTGEIRVNVMGTEE